MSEYKHIPSCKPNNKELVWHCSQCGTNEFAIDVVTKFERYRQALDFYADLKNWEPENIGGTYTCTPILGEMGLKARDALEKK